MRRITMWLLVTITVLVLLLSYRTSTMGVLDTPAAITVQSTPTAIGPIDAPTQPASNATGTNPGPSQPATKQTYTGSAVSTRYGPVQVQITVANGKITNTSATALPTSRLRDQQINATAVPILNQETLQAQSAHIDMVSGATYTSQGYIRSLQSALDQAKLG
jgi:uncharacterized protein with FMN-binding domain